jgi:superfamily II DNA or RNA helicase
VVRESVARVAVEPLNAVHDRISSDEQAVLYELRDHFTFDVPGAKFNPKVKAGIWDGKIRLFKQGRLYAGLRDRVESFCKERGYDFEGPDLTCNALNPAAVQEWIETLGLPEDRTPRDYQFDYFLHAIHAERGILKSPTASGKSLIIYLLARWYWQFGLKTLIIVPTKGLVGQMPSDFVSYNCPPELVSKRGEDRDTPFFVSTWQWVVRQDPEWFEQWGVVVGDEAHTFAAASLVKIMENLPECQYRIGTTGTIDESSPVNPLVLEGLFGPIYERVTSQDLQDQGHISKLKIKVVKLVHPSRVRKGFKKEHGDYDQEIDYLCGLEPRNRFLINLSTNLKGNTILLFRFVEKHGHLLWPMLQAATDKCHYIYGGVGEEERDEIKRMLEAEDSQTLLASVGTFSTGENVRRLDNIIFGAPYKSQIVVPQSIGRTLRLHEDKEGSTLYDVADDLSWKTRKNHTLRHMEERIKIYAREGFDYQVYEVPMEY